MYGDAIENQQAQTGQEDPNMQGHQTAEEILDLLDQEPGKGTPPEEEAEKIDNTAAPGHRIMKNQAETRIRKKLNQLLNEISNTTWDWHSIEHLARDLAAVATAENTRRKMKG